jgi:hypothetical protein
MDLDELVKHQLLKYIDQHVMVVFYNKAGDRCTTYGYIREVYDDHVVFEDNYAPDRFKIRRIKIIEPVPGGKDEEKRERDNKI